VSRACPHTTIYTHAHLEVEVERVEQQRAIGRAPRERVAVQRASGLLLVEEALGLDEAVAEEGVTVAEREADHLDRPRSGRLGEMSRKGGSAHASMQRKVAECEADHLDIVQCTSEVGSRGKRRGVVAHCELVGMQTNMAERDAGLLDRASSGQERGGRWVHAVADNEPGLLDRASLGQGKGGRWVHAVADSEPRLLDRASLGQGRGGRW